MNSEFKDIFSEFQILDRNHKTSSRETEFVKTNKIQIQLQKTDFEFSAS